VSSAESDELASRAARAADALRAAGDEETAAFVDELYANYERTRRRLVRLGFDLHDGPLQTLAANAADLRHFQAQLETAAATMPDGHKLVGRIDDLVARELVLAEEVRALIHGSEPDPSTTAQLSNVFAALVEDYDGFALQMSIDPSIDTLDLTDSQRIALSRVVHSALNNVAQHSGARTASVTVREFQGGIEAIVVDDGIGFDPARAERSERSIGLHAMHERVRLLDGELTVESRAGGPTTVRVTLPARPAGSSP
jgi:signal transduction histidine kinase